jgi:hypothetical protein
LRHAAHDLAGDDALVVALGGLALEHVAVAVSAAQGHALGRVAGAVAHAQRRQAVAGDGVADGPDGRLVVLDRQVTLRGTHLA